MEDYVLKWCSIFCVVPSFDARRVRFKARHCQVFAFVIGHLVALLVPLWSAPYSPLLFEHTIILYVNSIFSTLNLCYFNIEKFQRLMGNLKLLQMQLDYAHEERSGVSKLAVLGFIAANLIMLFPYLSYSVFTTELNFSAVFFVLMAIPYYIMHLQGALQIYLLLSIKGKFKSVNRCILKLQRQTQLITSTNKFYSTLCTSVTKFNELFGWTILLSLISFFMSLLLQLHSILYIIKFIINEAILVLFLPKILVQTLQAVILSKVCQDLLQENEVSFKNLALVLSTVKDESARKQLLAFKQDVNIYRPRVSAAGFFDVNHATLFMLFNLMVTYLIAMRQVMPY